MSDLTQLSDAELAQMLQQRLDEAKSMQPQIQDSSPHGALQYMGHVAMGAIRGIGDVLAVPEKLGYEAGGKVTDWTGSPAAGYATNVAIQAAPGFAGGLLNAGGKILRAPAEALMRSAIKPSMRDLEITGKVPRAITTMLNKGSNPLLPGVNVTPGGIETLRGMGTRLGNQAQGAIDASTADINGADVLRQGMDRPIREIMNYGDPQQALGQAERVAQNFADHPAIGDINSIPVQQAQKLKQGYYKQIDDSYGTPDIAGTNMTRKSMANALRQEIEKAVPDVVKPNAEASDIWNAINVAKRRALANGNRDPGGFAPFAHDPAGMMAYLLLRSPVAKSQVARALNASQRGVGVTAGSAPSIMADLLLNGDKQQ